MTRGLAILRCFDRPRAELTVSEIARQTGLSQPTAWRLCATLIDAGYLVRGPNGTSLRIGAPALSLGYAAINGMDLPSIALPYMRDVAERTGGTVNLSQRRGYEIISVEQCNGEFILPYRPVGWCATLPSAASGLAVLAVLPEPDLARTLAELERRDSAAWPRRRARIDKAIEQYRREGAVSQSALMGGLYAAVAVPLIESEGSQRRYWALGCGGLSSRWDEAQLHAAAQALKRIVTLLQPAAAALPGASPAE